MDNQAIFRLPGDSHIQLIRQDPEAPDSFVIRPFDRRKPATVIQGSYKTIGLQEAISVIDSWTLPKRPQAEVSDYRSLVRSAIHAIQNGDFFKVVPARRQLHLSDTRLSELFTRLEQAFPMAFVYVFRTADGVMIGASPETLITRQGSALHTEALGGTLTHGKYTGKELKEHEQIVEFIGSLLGRSGYSYEKSLTQPKVAGPVEHLCTGFKFETKGQERDLEIIEQLHPTPAVCGLPFDASYQFIEKNEGMDRRFYSGYIGQMSGNGDFKLFVNLRCAEVYQGAYLLYAGAGVNELSDPDDEYQETENKMKTIAQWLK